LDASSRAHDGVCCCAAMELGSDSARVNEVAKLCRAVVLGDESEWSSEGSACGFEREFEVGWLDDWDRRRQELRTSSNNDHGVVKRVCLSLCAMG
jgi:hypothetical protein